MKLSHINNCIINGIRPFLRDDILIIHRLIDIDFKDLIPPFLKSEVSEHIRTALGELKNKKIQSKIKNLESA